MEKKIIVVDDESTIRMLIRKLLSENGFYVLCADSGETAIKAIEKERYDLMILDLAMPGKNGIDVLERIRQINKNMPVILISAYLTEENTNQLNKLGIHSYVKKPFTSKKLLEEINSALNGQI